MGNIYLHPNRMGKTVESYSLVILKRMITLDNLPEPLDEQAFISFLDCLQPKRAQLLAETRYYIGHPWDHIPPHINKIGGAILGIFGYLHLGEEHMSDTFWSIFPGKIWLSQTALDA